MASSASGVTAPARVPPGWQQHWNTRKDLRTGATWTCPVCHGKFQGEAREKHRNRVCDGTPPPVTTAEQPKRGRPAGRRYVRTQLPKRIVDATPPGCRNWRICWRDPVFLRLDYYMAIGWGHVPRLIIEKLESEGPLPAEAPSMYGAFTRVQDVQDVADPWEERRAEYLDAKRAAFECEPEQ